MDLRKDVLHKSKLDGEPQKEVLERPEASRTKERNLCLLDGTNMAKPFPMQPLTLILGTSERPDGGSYQQEKRLGKALMFLYDFGYDGDAQEWCNWGYLQRFLESDPLLVAKPWLAQTIGKATASLNIRRCFLCLLAAPLFVKNRRGCIIHNDLASG